MIKFFIKYGEREHLQQIVDGGLRFSPSQTYIRLEEKQHNKGQGDLLEGKMKVNAEKIKFYNRETNECLVTQKKSIITVSIQNVSNMPIFCLSHYGDESIEDIDGVSKIAFDDEHIKGIKKDFPKATHALIIYEPDKFVDSVKNSIDRNLISDKIIYYDYSINVLQMYTFLTTGDEQIRTNEDFSMTYDNRYRHLLCKDISFENQREYRFIVLDELITKPKFYNFKFDVKYQIVQIDDLMAKKIDAN